MKEKHYKALELDKILALLAEQASCDDAREAAAQLRPQASLKDAVWLLGQTEDAFQLLARFGGPSFGGLKNVNNALSRAEAEGSLNMKELLDIAEVLRVIRSLSEWRERCAGVKTRIDAYFEALTPNKYLEDKITNAILSEEEMSDNASAELFDIRRKMRAAAVRVREKLDSMVRSAHYQKFLQDPIVTMRGGRFVVPVKTECRGEVAGLVHDTSSSGATVFVEPMAVVEANNEIKVLGSREQAEIERILMELSVEAGGFAGSVMESYEAAVALNLVFAKAQLAYKMKASVPIMNEEGILELKNARHPLIDPKKVVATNITLGKDFDTLVITGPNTGGKTVSIKTIGLLSAMAMCGLMIPVSDQSRVSVFDHILVDVGDEQSIEQSLSTFSAHMTNIISILETADSRSLVLIDELGAGTDPVEGAALAMSILERLHEKGAKIGATTHYAELKAYALQTPRVQNACCEFDVKTLKPTYRLLIGVPGRSNAFAISSRLGMEDRVVEHAKALVSTENKRFEDVVEALEESRQALEAERGAAEAMRREAEEIRREAGALKERVEREREQELERARGEARRMVEQARRQGQALMEELNQLKKEKASAANAAELARKTKALMKNKMNAFEDLVDPVREASYDDENYTLPRPLEAGDTVFVTTLGKEAQVAAPADKNGNVLVQAGLLQTRVKQKDLRLVKGRRKAGGGVTMRTVKSSSRAEMQVSGRCDLRGKMVEEALLDLDQYIDGAVMAGLGEITIIHGKGTGALRKAVQEHLRSHPSVKAYRLGVYGEGENGVTIAQVK